MAKTKLFNKGDVILTNPEEGFWGIAIVLSEIEKTPELYARCHIAVTPLIFLKQVEFSDLNPNDFVPLKFERQYTFELQNKKPEPFSKLETCIATYTRQNKADFKILGNINPDNVYKGELLQFPADGHAEKFWLGREAYMDWKRKNEIKE